MDPTLELTLKFIGDNLTKKEIKELLKDYDKETVKKILNQINKVKY